MAASKTKAAVDHALDRLSKLFPNEFKNATSNPANLQKIKSAAEDTTQEILKLIQNVTEKKSPEECFSHLPADRRGRIKDSLKFKTYQMVIAGDLQVQFMMAGQGGIRVQGLPQNVNVGQPEGANQAYYYLVASILLESLIFLLILLGIPVDTAIAKDIEKLKKIIEKIEKSREILERVHNMLDAFRRGDTRKVIESMLGVVSTLFDENVISDMVKFCISDMGPLDVLAILARLLSALFLLGGIAGTLADILSKIADVADFISKFKTLNEIQARVAR